MRAMESRADFSLCFQIALAPTLVYFLIGALSDASSQTNEQTHLRIDPFRADVTIMSQR